MSHRSHTVAVVNQLSAPLARSCAANRVREPIVLRTERDVIEALAAERGTLTLDEIYAACESAGVTTRDNGDEVIHSATDTRWRRRARNALQALRAAGRAERAGDGVWVIDGDREKPGRMLLVLCGEPSEVELVLSRAEDLFTETDELFDLGFADPPYALLRDRGQLRQYDRFADQVVPGYVDVDPTEYPEFTERWISAAVPAIREGGGYLVVVTGPQQAARVQVAAEDAGLTYVNSIAVRRPFALRTTRRFAHAHWTVTVLCKGSLRSRRRFYAAPPSLPRAASGASYPLDVWNDVPARRRPDQLRYDNELPPLMVERLLEATTAGPENGGTCWQSRVVDPFMGGGAVLRACISMKRRYLGCDVNPDALRYAAARVLTDVLWRPEQRPLFQVGA